MDSFAKCKDIAIAVAGEIPNSEIVYGLYTPLTPKESWDARWRGGKAFVHFWVEYRDKIIDLAKEQFGEPPISIIPTDDIRYVKVGHIENGEPIKIVDEPSILWGTYSGPSQPITQVIWPSYPKYLEVLEAIR